MGYHASGPGRVMLHQAHVACQIERAEFGRHGPLPAWAQQIHFDASLALRIAEQMGTGEDQRLAVAGVDHRARAAGMAVGVFYGSARWRRSGPRLGRNATREPMAPRRGSLHRVAGATAAGPAGAFASSAIRFDTAREAS